MSKTNKKTNISSLMQKAKRSKSFKIASASVLGVAVLGSLFIGLSSTSEDGNKTKDNTAEAGSLGGNTGMGYGTCGYGGDCDTGIGGSFAFSDAKTSPMNFKDNSDLTVVYNTLTVNYDDTIDGSDDYRCSFQANTMITPGVVVDLDDDGTGSGNTLVSYDPVTGCSVILRDVNKGGKLNWDVEVTVFDYADPMSPLTVGTAREGYSFGFAGAGA